VLGLLATAGLRAALLAGLGWVLGFVLAYGTWGAVLWADFANPVFPMFNGLFGSPWAPAHHAMDLRFLARDWEQVLAYPFWWLRGREFVASETGIRDAHFAMAWLAVLLLLGRRWWGDARLRLLLVFVVISYALWQAMFSILRYAVPLEVLSGIVVTAALHSLLPARQVTWAAFAVLVLLLATTSWPGFGRLRTTPERLFAITAPLLPAGSLVVTASKPVGFVLPFLHGDGLSFVGLNDLYPGTRLEAEILARISAAADVSVLIFREDWPMAARLDATGWRLDPATCAPVQTGRRRWAELLLCPAVRPL
jgi:hypothetical protein